MNWDYIEAVAEDVRIWTESRAEGTLNADDLNGWCARAAAELWRRLRAECLDPIIVVSESNWGCHVFLKLEDHILDVTATQFKEFRNDRVIVRHERELSDSDWHQESRTFQTDEELIRYQKRTKWPSRQIAFSK